MPLTNDEIQDLDELATAALVGARHAPPPELPPEPSRPDATIDDIDEDETVRALGKRRTPSH